MRKMIIFLLSLSIAAATSTSPFVSSLGDAFRSGEVAVSIGNQATYDFQAPYPSALGSNSITLALSMVDYNQSFDNTNKMFFHLRENTPSASNSTHAVFRVELGLYYLTSKASVKYLACLTSVLSQNFNIMVN